MVTKRKICFTVPRRPKGRYRKGRYVSKRVRVQPAKCFACGKKASYEVVNGNFVRPVCGTHRSLRMPGLRRKRKKFVTVTGYKPSAIEKRFATTFARAQIELAKDYNKATALLNNTFKRKV